VNTEAWLSLLIFLLVAGFLATYVVRQRRKGLMQRDPSGPMFRLGPPR